MGSYTDSKPRGLTILAAAEMAAMPGDVPKVAPMKMIKSVKQKVTKVKNIQHVVAGGPGSGRHTTFSVNTPDEVDKAHEALKKQGFKYDDGAYKHTDGRTASIHMKRKESVAAGGPGSGRRKELGDYLTKKDWTHNPSIKSPGKDFFSHPNDESHVVRVSDSGWEHRHNDIVKNSGSSEVSLAKHLSNIKGK